MKVEEKTFEFYSWKVKFLEKKEKTLENSNFSKTQKINKNLKKFKTFPPSQTNALRSPTLCLKQNNSNLFTRDKKKVRLKVLFYFC